MLFSFNIFNKHKIRNTIEDINHVAQLIKGNIMQNKFIFLIGQKWVLIIPKYRINHTAVRKKNIIGKNNFSFSLLFNMLLFSSILKNFNSHY